MKTFAIMVAAMVLIAMPVSVQWTQNRPALTLDKADAIIGRPATPRSVAGAHRRGYRAARRCAYYRGGYCVRWY
jgi:hypothetical protein